MQVPPKWEHILCVQQLPTRGVQVPPSREPTTQSAQTYVRDVYLFLNHWTCSFPWSNLDNPNLPGLVALTQLTPISCIINTVSLFISGIQARRAGTTNIIAAACGRFHAVFLQEASDHVPHISDQFIAHTGNTDLAILLNKDTFEPDPVVFAFKKTPQAKVRGLWYYSSFEDCCAAPHFLEHRRLHVAQYTSTMSLPRNVTHPLNYFSGYTGT